MVNVALQRRLQEVMDERGLTMRAWSVDAGLNADAVRNIFRGKSQFPRINTLEKLAAGVGLTVEQLLDGVRAGDLDEPPVSLSRIRVVGRVQAGKWLEAWEWPEDDVYSISVPSDERLRGKRSFALQVRGPSMNRVYPDGTLIICIKLIDWRKTLRSGQRVIVHRHTREGLVEATVKEYVIDEDGGIYLWPRSHHPDFQVPIPVADQGNDLEIVAIVVGSYRPETL